jgi:hypothetical protein
LLARAASLPPAEGLSAEDAEADRRARAWFERLAAEGERAAGVVTGTGSGCGEKVTGTGAESRAALSHPPVLSGDAAERRPAG